MRLPTQQQEASVVIRMIFEVAADNGSAIQFGGASSGYCRMFAVTAFDYPRDASSGVISFDCLDLGLGGKKVLALGQGCGMRLDCFNLFKYGPGTAN